MAHTLLEIWFPCYKGLRQDETYCFRYSTDSVYKRKQEGCHFKTINLTDTVIIVNCRRSYHLISWIIAGAEGFKKSIGGRCRRKYWLGLLAKVKKIHGIDKITGSVSASRCPIVRTLHAGTTRATAQIQ